jgi:LysR family transcriptional regulator, cell division regulator
VELTDLKIFIKIAEEGSISRAAERLDYVQSNVTARIRKLEYELCVPLFHRHPKGVTLTEKGAALREYAHKILTLTDEAVQAVQEPDYPAGPLAIGVVETVTCGNFMHALSEFQTEHPRVSLSLSTGHSQQLLSKVFNHELDGAFVTGPIQSSQLIFDYTVQDEVVLLTHTPGDTFPDHTAGDQYPDLSTTKWAVSPHGCPFRSILEEWLKSEGIALTNLIEISSLETLLSCVKSGLAATLLPASVLTGSYKELGVYPIPERFRFTQTSLIRRHDRFCSKAFTAFVDMIKQKGL